MVEFKIYLSECKNKIDAITQALLDKIEQNDLSAVSQLFMQRSDMLTELVTRVVTEQDRKLVLQYFIEYQSRNQAIIYSLSQEHEIVKNTLMNIKNISSYVNM